jgi:hypothetical protein
MMRVKDRAFEEIRVVDDLLQRLQTARECHKEVEATVVEAELDSHLRTFPDLVKSLSKSSDLESLALIHNLESRREEFMSPAAPELDQDPTSIVELEIRVDADHNDIYEPVQSTGRPDARPEKSSVSRDFFASLLLTVVVCVLFSIAWQTYRR